MKNNQITDAAEVVSEEAIKRMMARCLINRMCDPSEIANVIFFLASEDASYITGQVIGVNGGMHI